MDDAVWRSTTVLCARIAGRVAMAGDGQVSLGDTIIKSNAVKIRRLYNDKVLAGFAGSAADAFALLEKFERQLEQYNGDIQRASVELAKLWRTDKILRELQAMLLTADMDHTLIISGNGNVLEPEDDVASIGSGSSYARAAALAYLDSGNNLTARELVERSLRIAGRICVYTNDQISIEEL